MLKIETSNKTDFMICFRRQYYYHHYCYNCHNTKFNPMDPSIAFLNNPLAPNTGIQ